MDDDLYGDLDQIELEQSKPKSTTIIQLENQVNDLQALVELLKQENETLKRNMGTLYRTARSEIRRKDAEIESLTKPG